MEQGECLNIEKTAILSPAAFSLSSEQKYRAQSVPPTPRHLSSADIFGDFPRSASSAPDPDGPRAVTTTHLECRREEFASPMDKKSVDAILIRSMSEMRRTAKSKGANASDDDDDAGDGNREDEVEAESIARGRGRRRGGNGPRKRRNRVKESGGAPAKKRRVERRPSPMEKVGGEGEGEGEADGSRQMRPSSQPGDEKIFILITRGGEEAPRAPDKKSESTKKIAGGASPAPPCLAGELRTKLIADSSDPNRVLDRMLDQGLVVPNDAGVGVHVNTQILLSALPGPAMLTDSQDRTKNAEPMDLIKIENPSGALTVRASADLALAVDVSTRILLAPTAPRAVTTIGTHTCSDLCVYHRATEKCGLRGCEPLAIQFERQIGSGLPHELRDSIRPEDIWVCERSGALHVCTRELCDSLDPNKQQDRYVCRKTGLEHGQIMAPPSDSFFDGRFHPSAEVTRIKDDGYMRQVARPETGAWLLSCSAPWQRVRLAGTDHDPRRANGYYRRRRFRSNLLKKQDKVKGRTACLVESTLRARAERAFPDTDPGAISADKLASAEATQRLREIDEIFASESKKRRSRELLLTLLPPSSSETEKPVRRLAAAPQTSSELVLTPKKDGGEELSEDDSDSTASARLMPSAVACYRRAFEMAAVTVVILPVVLKANPALSSERQRQCAERYGALVWRGWTLVAGSPTSESQDAEVKFRHFSLGIIYQAKYGFSVSFDLRSVPEYRTHRAAVDAAVHSLTAGKIGAAADATEMEIFARRNAIRFLNAESYLDTRLVQENKIGMKNTSIDGIQIESVGVNAGIRLVKDGLSAIAEWAKKRFIEDVVAGISAPEALRRARVRARAMLVTPPLPSPRSQMLT